MKKIYSIGLVFLVFSCATVDQNFRARQNLLNCKYELEKIEFNRVSFINVIEPQSVFFDNFLKITNTTNEEVAFDRFEGTLYLDENKLNTIDHKNFVRIKSKESATEIIGSEIGFAALSGLNKKRPDKITIEGKIYINLLSGDYTLKTPFFVSIKKTFSIPYDKIEAAIQNNQQSSKKGTPEIDNVKKQLKQIEPAVKNLKQGFKKVF